MWTRAKDSRGGRCALCGSRFPGDPLRKFRRGCEWQPGHRPGTTYYLCVGRAEGAMKVSFNEKLSRTIYHHLVESASLRPALTPELSEVRLAPPARCYAAYTSLLTGKLYSWHAKYVEARRIPAELARRARWTSLAKTSDRRDRVAREIAESGVDLVGVPGFWRDHEGNWRLEGPGGLLLPVRNEAGLVSGCVINTDWAIQAYLSTLSVAPSPEARDLMKKSKYLWLTSKPELEVSAKGAYYIRRKTGVGATPQLHFPLREPDGEEGLAEEIDRVVSRMGEARSYLLVEGVLKSDVVAYLWEGDEVVIGMPGSGAAHREANVLFISADRVLIAFDIDWQTNPDVRTAMRSLVSSIKTNSGLERVEILCWPVEAGKGLDDVLLAGHRDRLHKIQAAAWLDWNSSIERVESNNSMARVGSERPLPQDLAEARDYEISQEIVSEQRRQERARARLDRMSEADRRKLYGLVEAELVRRKPDAKRVMPAEAYENTIRAGMIRRIEDD